MIYFIIWVVILLGCIIALPVASMMDKRKRPSAPVYDDNAGQDEYENYEESGQEVADDGFGGDQGFAEDAMPAMDQPVGDDFSAFDEEFK